MRSLPILLLPLILVVTEALAATSKALPGGWQPIKDVNDPHVQEIAKFSVSEHNKLANTRLAFSKVVKGETQVVAGINYRLVVKAKDGGTMATYEAVVWEKAWEGFRKLTSFKPVKS